MTANLAANGQTPMDNYSQLLHIDGGLSATATTVSGGSGTASALKLGTGDAQVDNLKFDGNTISSTDTNGNINLTPDGSGSVVVSKVAITTGEITALSTPLPIAAGGTAGATASAARTALGLDSMATQAASAVAITGGTISGVTTYSGSSIRATGSIGYGAGAGSSVTQATNKSTGVTLNNICGQITMNNAALAAATSVSFTLTNSEIAAYDVVMVNIASAASANSYQVCVDAVAAGSCRIHVRNITAATSLGEALILNFVVLKGVIA